MALENLYKFSPQWDINEMADILHIFWNAFSFIENIYFLFKFHIFLWYEVV